MYLRSYNYQSALLAFILWGAWAYYINIQSDNNIISALSQGMASFVVTLIMIKIIKYFYRLLPEGKLFFILPSVITVSITSSVIVGVHLIVNTENIFYTVLPTVIVAFLFALFTTQRISMNTTKKGKKYV